MRVPTTRTGAKSGCGRRPQGESPPRAACPLWTTSIDGKVSFVDYRLTLRELLECWAPYDDELLLHDPDGPSECLVRRGELVAVPESLDPVIAHLGRWIDSVHHEDRLPLARVRLRSSERGRCVDIARDAGSTIAGVAANHVHLGSPMMFGTPVVFGTGAEVQPSAPIPKPPAQRWDPPVTVGVLDTGLDPHPWFAARPWFEPVSELLDANDDSGQDRQAGHGTFVSGLVLQHAPGAVIRSQRVLSSLGFTDDLTVAAGLRSLRRIAASRGEHLDVLTMTSGCHTADDVCPVVLRRELERYRDVVVVAAAGNQSLARPFWPAALPTVVAVAATDADGAIAEFSNAGPWVDAAAPGVEVVSSHVRLESSGAPGATTRSYGCAKWSGTSFSAPLVAAAAAVALHDGYDATAAARIAQQRYPFGR
jgi:thermitase